MTTPVAAHPTTALAAPRCLNCGAPFTDPRPRFCPDCGQESRIKPPRMVEFAQQFGGAYLSTEGALWRTLKLLLFKPGELTRQYLAGRRKHYVLPLRLYLTISVTALLLMRLLAAVDIEIGPRVAVNPDRPRTTMNLELGGGRAGLRQGVFFCENLPVWMCKRIQRRVDIDPAAIHGEIEAIKERFIGNLGAAMFVLLPGFALWMKLVYWNRRLHYTEHLVFALHVHAFWFIALVLALSNVWWLVTLACIAVPLYTMLAMKRVFGGRRWVRFGRAFVVSALYGITLALALGGVGVWTLLF